MQFFKRFLNESSILGLCFVLCPLSAVPLIAEEEVILPELPRIYSRLSHQRQFITVSNDFASTQRVTQIANQVEKDVLRYFPSVEAVRRVKVQLRVPDDMPVDRPYSIRVLSSGDVIVELRWSELTQLEQAVQLLLDFRAELLRSLQSSLG